MNETTTLRATSLPIPPDHDIVTAATSCNNAAAEFARMLFRFNNEQTNKVYFKMAVEQLQHAADVIGYELRPKETGWIDEQRTQNSGFHKSILR